MKSLFIGRFQPFHKGHIQIIKKIKNNFEEIIIGIGSSQYHHTITNPFTSEERKLMIRKSLEEIDIKNYKIYLIPDVHNVSIWVEYVTSIVSDFDVVITNNLFTKNLFMIMILSFLLCLILMIFGSLISYYLNIPPGATIASLTAIFYIITLFFQKNFKKNIEIDTF